MPVEGFRVLVNAIDYDSHEGKGAACGVTICQGFGQQPLANATITLSLAPHDAAEGLLPPSKRRWSTQRLPEC
jgi:hypothetical protein